MPPPDSPTLALLQRIEHDWRALRPAVESGPMLTLLLLSRLQAALAREVAQTYQAHGINAAGWDLLLTLYRSAPERGLTPTELSHLTAISGPAVSNRLERLLERGLIERWTGQRDRRSFRVGLSAPGRQLVSDLLPTHMHTAERLLAVLSGAEQTQLRSFAERLVSHAEKSA